MRTLLALATLALALPASAATVDYETQIKPIFEAKCIKCHGEKKQLGRNKLAMHTSALIEVIEDGSLLVAEDAENSEIFARLILEADDKALMPKGSKPLPKEQIELIKKWIDEGASLAKLEGAAPAPKHGVEAEAPLPAAEPLSADILKAIAETGASVVPLYSGSPLLSISYPSNPKEVTDATVDKIAAAGANVVWLSLSGSQVTDAGAQKLAACKNLMRLHLENTKVTDEGVKSLAELKLLEYLNLYGTGVTDATIAQAAALPKLKRLYVWQTGVSYEAAKKLMGEREGLEVNLGWNHPGVVRERLTKELERVAKRKVETAQQAKQAEADLNEAKKQLEGATAREAELKKELEALNKPATKEKPEEKAKEETKAKSDKKDA